MHAVLVKVNISEPDAALDELRERVVPGISAAPGFVAGYWTRKDNSGVSMIVFDTEEGADSAAERVGSSLPQGVTLESVEVREVVASA